MFKPKFLFLLSPTSCFTTIPFIEGLGFKSEDELQTWLPCELVESVEDDNVEEVNADEKSDDDCGGLVYELVTSCTCLGFVFEMLLSPSPNLFELWFSPVVLILILVCFSSINNFLPLQEYHKYNKYYILSRFNHDKFWALRIPICRHRPYEFKRKEEKEW